jgi:hypothetical protein
MLYRYTLEDWDEVMYAVMNTEYRVAGAYFVTLVIVGTYFIVSVFVAAISGVFLRLRKDHQVRSRFLGLLIG